MHAPPDRQLLVYANFPHKNGLTCRRTVDIQLPTCIEKPSLLNLPQESNKNAKIRHVSRPMCEKLSSTLPTSDCQPDLWRLHLQFTFGSWAVFARQTS